MSRQPSSARSALFVPGVAFMCGGVWLTAFLFVLAIIGVPLFLIGLVLTWVSSAPAWAKVLATVAPFAIWVGITLVLMAVGPHAPSATFLVPDGYRGVVAVVYNESCAPPLPQEDGRRLVAVPADGIVLASDHEDLDWPVLPRDDVYVRMDRQGRRRGALLDLHDPESGPEQAPVDSSRLGVLFPLGPTTGATDAVDPDVWFMYQEAYIGTIRTWNATGGLDLGQRDRIGRRVLACRRAAGQPDGGPPGPPEGGTP